MPPKKPEPPKKDLLGEVVLILMVLYFLWAIYGRVQDFLFYSRYGSVEGVWGTVMQFFFTYFWPSLKFVGVCVVALAVVGIAHSVKQLMRIVEEERKVYGLNEDSAKPGETQAEKNLKWERVVNHINSTNSSDWKLAIIEADIMLDELLRVAGYHGDSIGEMLKAVEKSDFLTLDQAWEAHKVRNRIAHDGAAFELTERDAKHVISLYEAVFKEFKII